MRPKTVSEPMQSESSPVSAIRIAIISLGCPKNLVDSEELMGYLGMAGATVCDRAEDADIIVINTCGFIEEAKQESIDLILDAARIKEKKGDFRIVVTGCMAQRYGQELKQELPEIDHVVGLRRYEDVARACGLPGAAEAPGRLRLTPRHYAYLRVSEGCDNRCAYCAIPSIRGPLRSAPLDELAAEARELVADGAVELNLVGQDTTAYGLDTADAGLLPELIGELAEIDGLQWIRVLYAHPRHLTDRILEAMTDCPKVCRYVDLPVQHINDRVLAAMDRHVSSEEVRRLIRTVRAAMPGVFIRTSVIVGFPGETDEEFEELLAFIRDARFERLGAFAYSREEGTPAWDYPDQIPEELKDERLDRVMSCQQEIAFEQNQHLIGGEIHAILEERADDVPERWRGRSEGDAPEVDGTVVVSGRELAQGRIVRVRITGVDGYDLLGECVGV